MVFVGFALVLSDEFNVNGAPDSSKWGCDLGAGGWGNNESQYYTKGPENVIVQDGLLKIKRLKECFSGSNYTSASLPFIQIFFLIINYAMGWNFCRAIDPNFTVSTFEVDYIRVYN